MLVLGEYNRICFEWCLEGVWWFLGGSKTSVRLVRRETFNAPFSCDLTFSERAESAGGGATGVQRGCNGGGFSHPLSTLKGERLLVLMDSFEEKPESVCLSRKKIEWRGPGGLIEGARGPGQPSPQRDFHYGTSAPLQLQLQPILNDQLFFPFLGS